jgi:hypothetical protein
MKIFSFKNKAEGEAIPPAYLMAGRLIKGDGKFNGFYVYLKSPFTRRQEFTSPIDFKVYTGPCQMSYGLMVRRVRGVGPWRMFRNAVWTPVEWP